MHTHATFMARHGETTTTKKQQQQCTSTTVQTHTHTSVHTLGKHKKLQTHTRTCTMNKCIHAHMHTCTQIHTCMRTHTTSTSTPIHKQQDGPYQHACERSHETHARARKHTHLVLRRIALQGHATLIRPQPADSQNPAVIQT